MKHRFFPSSVPGKEKRAKPSFWIISLFFGIGMISGCIAAYLFQNQIYASLFHTYRTLLDQFPTLEINPSALFSLALGRHLKYLLLLFLLGCTNIWRYYFRIFLSFAGIQNGLLLSFCIQMNGLTGMIGYLCFLLPHAVLLCPAYLIAIRSINALHSSWYGTDRPKNQAFWSQLPALLAALILIFAGCLLEATCNPALLRLYFR